MNTTSTEQHRAEARAYGSIALAVLTVSDTRTRDTDTSGQLIHTLVAASEHHIVDYRIVKDEPSQIQAAIKDFCTSPVQAILTHGGTGISTRDQTCDVVAALLEKELPGFGELFRMLSHAEVGAAALLSRALAGIYRERFIFCMPGSSNAVRLAMTQLILPEIQHLVRELNR